MGYQPIEELLPRANGSIYSLVRMASSRAIELAEGKPALVKGLNTDKETSIALREIAKGLVELKEVAQARSTEKKK